MSSKVSPTVPICAVGALIFSENRILLIKRGKPPSMGQWSLPGGAVQLGETLQEAIIREVHEEVRLNVSPVFVGTVVDRIFKDEEGRIAYHYIIIDYVCESPGGEPVAGSDAAAVGYFGLHQLDSLDMTQGTADVIREVHNLWQKGYHKAE
jgi:8-oxo-dGTP diphosphatase